MESNLENRQCGFRPGRSTSLQIFALNKILEKSSEYGKELFACSSTSKKIMTEFLGVNS